MRRRRMCALRSNAAAAARAPADGDAPPTTPGPDHRAGPSQNMALSSRRVQGITHMPSRALTGPTHPHTKQTAPRGFTQQRKHTHRGRER
jgi:hypothetical protein